MQFRVLPIIVNYLSESCFHPVNVEYVRIINVNNNLLILKFNINKVFSIMIKRINFRAYFESQPSWIFFY